MLKILALFAVASAELPCPADATATTWCKDGGGYIGQCNKANQLATTYTVCIVNPNECANKVEGAECGGGGGSRSFGKCETPGGKCKYEECPADATATTWCKDDGGYIGQCTKATPEATAYTACIVKPNECANKVEGAECGGGGSRSFGKCETPGGKCKYEECPADATDTTWCKDDGGYLGQCTKATPEATAYTVCFVKQKECQGILFGMNCGEWLGWARGEWFRQIGTCETGGGKCKSTECTTAPTVTNGTLTCTDAQKVPGSTEPCTLACKTKYKIKTATANKCSDNGVWTGDKGECESSYAAALSGVAAVLVAGLVGQ